MNGSPWRLFSTARSPKRRFSHLWVGRDGSVEQYAALTSKSWAQGGGNATYWSVETDGQPWEPLTDAQLDTLADWHVWCGAADVLADRSGERGIGTHYMGGKTWGGHSCPDPAPGGQGPRSKQRADIITRARRLRAHHQEDDMALSDDDVERVARRTAELVTGIGAVHPVRVDEGTGAAELPGGDDIDAIPTVLSELQAEQRRQAAVLDTILTAVRPR